MTDNATYSGLGMLVSGNSNNRVIHEPEAALAMKIIAESGLDITQKAIWNDRDYILAELDEGDVQEWLASLSEGSENQAPPSMPDIHKDYVMAFRGYFEDVAYHPTRPVAAVSACRQRDPIFHQCSLGAVLLWDTSSGSFLGSFEQLNNGAPAIAWSPDGTRLATTACITWDETSECGRAKVIVVDAQSFSEVYSLEYYSVGRELAYSADGRYLAVPRCVRTNITECRVAILNAADGSEDWVVATKIGDVRYTHLAFAPEGSTLIIGSTFGLMLVDASEPGSVLTVLGNDYNAPINITRVRWSPDGSLVGVIGRPHPQEKYIFKLDSSDPTGLSLAASFSDIPVNAYLGDIVWSPDGETLALSVCDYVYGSGCDPAYIALYDTSGSLPAELTAAQKLNWLDAWAMDFAPDGSSLAFVDAAGEALRLVDISGEP